MKSTCNLLHSHTKGQKFKNTHKLPRIPFSTTLLNTLTECEKQNGLRSPKDTEYNLLPQ